jgi:2-oxoglutarate-dependent dioxygenase
MEQSGAPLERLRRAAGSGDKLRQVTQYLEGSKLDAVINSPSLLGVAAQLMQGPSTVYLPFTAVKNGGGGGRFHFHQDNQYTRFDGPGVNIWLALVPMSPENGCLEIVPRSHLRGTFDAVASGDGDAHVKVGSDPSHFLPIRMRPGDAVAFSRLTIHGSGPNTTSEPRFAYAVQFHRDDVKATWDNQPPRSLKEHPRWSTRPVQTITPPEEKSLDGH